MTAEKRPADRYDVCPVVYSLDILGRKWRLPILCELDKHGVMRYNELKRSVTGITNMMLAQALRELETCGLVLRIQHNEIPPRVEYSLTDAGKDLFPGLCQLARWGGDQLAQQGIATGCGAACLQNLVPQQLSVPRDPRVVDMLAHFDEGFERIRRELTEDPLHKNRSGLYKMREFFCRATSVLTLEDEDYTRMTYMMMFGFNRIQFVDHERPYYRIMRRFIEEGRQDGSVRCPLPDDEVVQMIATFSSGMIMKWEIARGAYPLVERNRPAIDWFFKQLGED